MNRNVVPESQSPLRFLSYLVVGGEVRVVRRERAVQQPRRCADRGRRLRGGDRGLQQVGRRRPRPLHLAVCRGDKERARTGKSQRGPWITCAPSFFLTKNGRAQANLSHSGSSQAMAAKAPRSAHPGEAMVAGRRHPASGRGAPGLHLRRGSTVKTGVGASQRSTKALAQRPKQALAPAAPPRPAIGEESRRSWLAGCLAGWAQRGRAARRGKPTRQLRPAPLLLDPARPVSGSHRLDQRGELLHAQSHAGAALGASLSTCLDKSRRCFLGESQSKTAQTPFSRRKRR
jgi:hypothetical protein